MMDREEVTNLDIDAQAMHQPFSPLQAGHVSRRRMLRLALALPLAVIAAGCGQKGPLYHPPESGEGANDEEARTTPTAPGSRPT